MPKNYIVIYDYEFIIIPATSVKECIVKLSAFTGDKYPLFTKALNGCETTIDYIDMYNRFSDYQINAIYELGNELYADSGMNEHYILEDR